MPDGVRVLRASPILRPAASQSRALGAGATVALAAPRGIAVETDVAPKELKQWSRPRSQSRCGDYYKIVRTMSGEEAFGSLSNSACPLVKQ